MRNLIIITLFVLCLSAQAQQQYLQKVAWRTEVINVIQLTDWTYRVTIDPIDVNEPGALNKVIGNYLKDWAGFTYLIIDSTETTS